MNKIHCNRTLIFLVEMVKFLFLTDCIKIKKTEKPKVKTKTRSNFNGVKPNFICLSNSNNQKY